MHFGVTRSRRRVEHLHQLGADVAAFLLDYADANRLAGQSKRNKYGAATCPRQRVGHSAQGVAAISEFFEFDG